MAKLSLNKAAAYSGKAKADILKALKSEDPLKKLSGAKNEKGHWEIDTAELDRVFGKKSTEIATTGNELVSTTNSNRSATPENSSATSNLEVEVATLREQLRSAEKEKGYLNQKIEDLKERAERAEKKEDEPQARLPAPKRGLWARLVG